MRKTSLLQLGVASLLGLAALEPVYAAPRKHAPHSTQSAHAPRAARRPAVDEDQSFLDPGKDSRQPRPDLYVMEQVHMHPDPIRANQRGLYFNELAGQRMMDQWEPNSPFPLEPGIPVTPGYFR